MNTLMTWLPIVAPLACAFWAACVASKDSGLLRFVGLLAPVLSLLAAALAWRDFDANTTGPQYLLELPWSTFPGLTMGFGIDAISFPLLVAGALVTAAAILLVDADDKESPTQVALLLLTFAACNTAFLSTNLFWFFFFCELTTLPKFLLIQRYPEKGAWLTETPATRVALQVTIYIVFGAMAVMASLAFLSAHAGTLNMADLKMATNGIDDESQAWLFGLAVAGFGMWGTMWPLHGWAPSVYSTGRAPANMLYGGVVKAFGVYGLIRLGNVLPAGVEVLSPVLIVLGCVGVLYAAYVCFRQTDWNRLLAYSSVSHAGFAFVALGIGTEQALAALPLLLFAHGVTAAVGFALSRELLRQTGFRDTTTLSGIATAAPSLGVGFAVFTVCACGLPGSATFVGELMVFFGVWGAQHPLSIVAILCCAFGVVVSAVYMFRALHATFFGKSEASVQLVSKTPRTASLVAVWLLIAAVVVVGVFPRIFTDLLPGSKTVATAQLQGPKS